MRFRTFMDININQHGSIPMHCSSTIPISINTHPYHPTNLFNMDNSYHHISASRFLVSRTTRSRRSRYLYFSLPPLRLQHFLFVMFYRNDPIYCLPHPNVPVSLFLLSNLSENRFNPKPMASSMCSSHN